MLDQAGDPIGQLFLFGSKRRTKKLPDIIHPVLYCVAVDEQFLSDSLNAAVVF